MNPLSDLQERQRALDTNTSVLVDAPAGSGKTTLLTQRFLALLSEVSDPRQIVAITFTNAAAAEMRHRVLDALAHAASGEPDADKLAYAALAHARTMGWNLMEQTSALRISTIDSFCRNLALQQPLLAGMGGSLSVVDHAEDIYREAARRTLREIDHGSLPLQEAIATLLLWRDNSWHELEGELTKMLASRDRWMQGFVFDSELDEKSLRASLERPFARAAIKAIGQISTLLDATTVAEITSLATFACSNLDGARFSALAGCKVLDPPADVSDLPALESVLFAYQDLATLLFTKEGQFRAKITKAEGFPATAKTEKERTTELIEQLSSCEGFQAALDTFTTLPPLRYSDEEWSIVRSCFVLLRHAAAQLKTLFSEMGRCDFVEIAQIAQQALSSSESGFAFADDIHHLLVDEFQDTSRKQHRLLADLISHWQDRTNRTCFVVGDPRQSIYFFRDAEVELFQRVQNVGLEVDSAPLAFTKVQLTANFRTVPGLVSHLNDVFAAVFATDDGSGLKHTHAEPARKDAEASTVPHCSLHLEFVPAVVPFTPLQPSAAAAIQEGKEKQMGEIVELVGSLQQRVEIARREGRKYRIAVLGRSRKALLPIASALRSAGLPYRAVDLEPLADRPEVTDALILARALFSPEDRVAWLGMLRAPWAGLSLSDLHTLTSSDDPALMSRPVVEVANSRLQLLEPDTQATVRRVLDVAAEAAYLRASQPTQTLGAWLETVWQRIGGAACVDAQGRANLHLLWSVLDQLPKGETDLMGPVLGTALKQMKAQPNPEASSTHGVQLMTIHKSKGLEFEVVIVPEMQSSGGGIKLNMLSWLERGLSDVDTDLPTEFLVAPFSPKGAEGGTIKRWVDSEYRAREKQEMRRLLYVSATRARDELHLFARPAYRQQPDGSRTLSTPGDSLLSTAWPALEEEVQLRFAAFQPSTPAPVTTTAAPMVIRRLPASYTAPSSSFAGISLAAEAEDHGSTLYARESGSTESRILGVAVHTLLEKLALWRCRSLSWDDCRARLSEERARIAARMRAAGLTTSSMTTLTNEAIGVAEATTNDPNGQWLLSLHPESGSEVKWTGVLAGQIRTVQSDRVFRAGDAPLDDSDKGVYWIIDYKTAAVSSDPNPTELSRLRSLFSPQLDVYARVLRQLHGDGISIRCGLYYPRMLVLDWWSADC